MDASKTQVKKFLSIPNTQFVIPLYQRSFDWGDKHCEQLFKGILEIGHDKEDNAAYFIGSMVYIQNTISTTSSVKELVIVDGQQRLTTLTLIYLVLHRQAKALNDKKLAEEIYEVYLINKFSSDAGKIKLKPIEGDDTALAHLLEGKDSKDYSEREYSKIINAFNYFNKHITKENSQAVQNGLERLMFVEIARELRKSEQRGESLGLTEDEIAFYDALAKNESAKAMLGDEKLRTIAQLLVDRVRRSVSVDWMLRENPRAKIRAMVKRILREYGYPPDMQNAATYLVIEQAEVLCKGWSIE